MIPRYRTASISGLFLLFLVGFHACAPKEGLREPAPTRVPGAARVVAIGDLHGDLDAARAALRLAGAMNEQGDWVGGDLVVVQTGDVLDRGDDEAEIWELLQRLAGQARDAGGAVYRLNGNHELMNAYWDFRYVTEGGFADFRDTPLPPELDSLVLALEPEQRGRAAAFRPGGPAALRMARQNVAQVVGRTLFVHGGIVPEVLEPGLDSLNLQARAWLTGEAPEPAWVRGEESPVWTRLYSRDPAPEACDTLCHVLDTLDLDRMVVGHTVQQTGITAFCGGRVWAIDVGMAEAYGGRPEVLEIRGGSVRSLR